MNDNDRERLSRMMGILGSIPPPRLSLSPEAIGGLVTYTEDMKEAEWAIREVCNGMCLEGREGLWPESDYLDPDKVLNAFDQWLSERRQDDWAKTGQRAESYYEYSDDA